MFNLPNSGVGKKSDTASQRYHNTDAIPINDYVSEGVNEMFIPINLNFTRKAKSGITPK